MSGLREYIGEAEWDRYTETAKGGQFYGVRVEDMTREELLVTLGFALIDWPKMRQYPVTPDGPRAR